MSGEHILMDANVLLLLVVARAAPGYVRHHKRLQEFDERDGELLISIVDDAASIVTTPNAWTEVSNIITFGVPAELRNSILWELKTQIEQFRETYVASSRTAGDYAFLPLGLGDTSLWRCSRWRSSRCGTPSCCARRCASASSALALASSMAATPA